MSIRRLSSAPQISRWIIKSYALPILAISAILAILSLSDPSAISHNMSRGVADRLHAIDRCSSRDRPDHAQEIGAHHAFVLGVDLGRVHLVHLALCGNCYSRWMP